MLTQRSTPIPLLDCRLGPRLRPSTAPDVLGRLRKSCPMILEKFREGPRSKDVGAVREDPWRRPHLRCVTKGSQRNLEDDKQRLDHEKETRQLNDKSDASRTEARCETHPRDVGRLAQDHRKWTPSPLGGLPVPAVPTSTFHKKDFLREALLSPDLEKHLFPALGATEVSFRRQQTPTGSFQSLTVPQRNARSLSPTSPI